jgi:hypothetical protein
VQVKLSSVNSGYRKHHLIYCQVFLGAFLIPSGCGFCVRKLCCEANVFVGTLFSLPFDLTVSRYHTLKRHMLNYLSVVIYSSFVCVCVPDG